MGNNLALEYSLTPRRRGRRPAESVGAVTTGKLPRVTRVMALAIKFDGMIRDGIVRDYADLARLGYVTRARMTQIMNMLNLAPDIQEQILLFPPTTTGRDPISEHALRRVTALVRWDRWLGMAARGHMRVPYRAAPVVWSSLQSTRAAWRLNFRLRCRGTASADRCGPPEWQPILWRENSV